jgi:arylsulfatase A-like enzyme
LHALQRGAVAAEPAVLARLGELYQGEIAYVDAQLGRLVSTLRARGRLDDTILVVTGDHGESFGEHGDWLHGLALYESEIHVPLLLRHPHRLPAGQVVAGPVQHVDVFPTLLDLAGLRAREVQGTSLLPLLRGQASPPRVAFTELADDAFVAVLTTPDWKLIRNDATGELRLYRLDVDGGERVNLAKSEPTVTRALAAQLRDRMIVAGVSR